MPNKHFCQGPHCHEKTTQDRFLKSRGVVRGRYAYANLDEQRYYSSGDKYFCSQSCKFQWLEENMSAIEMGIPVPFIKHRRETGGYAKITNKHTDYHGNPYTSSRIERVDNRTELD